MTKHKDLADRIDVAVQRARDVRDSAAQMQPHDAEEMRDQLFELACCVADLAAALRASQ